jgi:transaldolase
LRRKAAVAQARLAYRAYLELFAGLRLAALEKVGARAQRPLWASTSTKNPAYPDLVYVDTLVAHNTVNTMPEETLEHYLDHGVLEPIRDADLAEAAATFESLAECGVDMADVSAVLEREGVAALAASFDDLLGRLQDKADAMGTSR